MAFTEFLFQRIGYKETSPGLFQLFNPQTLDSLLTIAFECFVGHWEMTLIDHVWKSTLHLGVRLRDIVGMRAANSGSESDLVNRITKKYSSSVHKSSPDTVKMCAKSANNVADAKLEHVSLKGDTTDAFRSKLNKHLADVNNINMDDIPFMDETTKETEYTAGNFDDHLKESLQVVGEKDKSFEVVAPPTGSQEWSFVNEGLTKKYGQEYFDGIRKDILSNGKNPGYVKVIAKEPVDKPYHKYVNLPVKPTENSSTDYKQMSMLTKDSDYYSTSTPTYTESQVATKAMPAVRYPPPPMQYSHSEVIATRIPPDPPAPHAMTSSPYSYVMVPNPAQMPSTRNDLSNLQKMSKQSSITNQPLTDQGPKVPARLNLASRSQSERMTSRNVADGSVPMQRQMSASLGRPSVHNANKWPCTYCTFLNNATDNVCLMCSKSREHVDTDGVPIAGTTLKVCGKCTLENDKNDSVCTACGHELQKTQTMV